MAAGRAGAVLQGLLLLAMGPLGYGVGVLASGPGDAFEPPAPVRSAAPTPRPDPRPEAFRPPARPPADTGDEALAACQRQLEACQALARVQRTQAIGAPRPWTDAIPERHRPLAVREAVDRVEGACGVERTVVDCAEHPCIVYVPAEISLADCPAWPYAAPASGGVSPDPDDVDLRIHYVLEPGEQHPLADPDWRPRLEHRLESNRAWVEDRFREEAP